MQFLPIVVWTVAILALIPGLALGVPPSPKPSGDEPKGLRTTTTATTERIPLGPSQGSMEMSTDALARRIRLRPSKKDSSAALAARIAKHVGMLCPDVRVKDGWVELSCRSRRIEVQITREGKTSYLDINELRGLPWRAGPDAPASYHYDPWRIGLGHSCPGKNEASQGECYLKQGLTLEAAGRFRAALATKDRQMACVRLGDLALGIGDPVTAAGWYRRVGDFGFFGRIASGRLCELDGTCLGSTEDVMRTFDPKGLPEPMRAESLMRAARAEAYAGRLSSAARIVARQARDHGMTSICREGGDRLCRRIVLEAMGMALLEVGPVAGMVVRGAGAAAGPRPTARPLEKAERENIEELIETYLSFPSWEQGEMAVEMAQAAAPLAARLGAPAFAGSLLASLAPFVPAAQLSDHLLLAAETFMFGEHWARARIVSEYAQIRLGPKNLKTARWAAVLRTLTGRADEDEVPPAVRAAIEAELVLTLAELKNARGALAKAEGVLGGARDAKSARRPATPTGPTSGVAKPNPTATATAAATNRGDKP